MSCCSPSPTANSVSSTPNHIWIKACLNACANAAHSWVHASLPVRSSGPERSTSATTRFIWKASPSLPCKPHNTRHPLRQVEGNTFLPLSHPSKLRFARIRGNDDLFSASVTETPAIIFKPTLTPASYSPMRIAHLRQRLRDLGAKPCHEDRLLRGWSQVCSYDRKHSPAEAFFPLALRNELPAIEAELNGLARLCSEYPAGEGVARLLVELADGSMVESVLLPRGGLCVSTQVRSE